MRHGLVYVLVLVGVSSGADAADEPKAVRFKCGDYCLLLDGTQAWTMKEFSYKGNQFLSTEQDAYNGTAVCLPDGTWYGSGYGGEIVKSRVLKVDGKRKLVKEGESYTAEEKIIFEKNSTIKVYRVSAAILLTREGVTLSHSYRRARRESARCLLAFMLCWDERFRLYIGQIPGDAPQDVMAKRFDGMFYDQETTNISEDIRYFALFDTLIHTGVVCYYGDPYRYKGEEECSSLRDTGKDRRFHFRPLISHSLGEREQLEFTLTIKAFECPTGKWKKTAAQIAGSDWR